MWKDRTSLLKPDVRHSYVVKIMPNGETTPFAIEDLYDMLAPLELPVAVPAEIRTQFDLARSAYLYSWFAYDMATLAEQQAYAVIEAAIKFRANEAKSGLKPKAGLHHSIEHAVSEGWLHRKDFEFDGGRSE